MRYTWQSSQSPIQEVIVSPPGKKAAGEAVIFAPTNGATAALSLDRLLAEQGMSVSYDIIDNRPALRVGHFSSEQQLIAVLQESGLVQGEAQQSELQKQKKGFDKLTAAAVFYQFGNVTGWIGNFLRKDNAGLISDSAFIVGDTTMLAFGKKSMAEKQHAVLQGFSKILKQNGVVVDEGSVFTPERNKNLPGLWNGVRRFMTDKVILVKSASEVTAGLMKSKAGFGNQNNAAKGTAGLLIASGFAAGYMVPEKTSAQLRDEFGAADDAELKHKIAQQPFFKRILLTIQRMPLILSGSFSGLNNLFSIWGALDEKNYYKNNQGASRKEHEIDAKLKGTSYNRWVFGYNQTVEPKDQGAIRELELAENALKAEPGSAALRQKRDKAWETVQDLEADKLRVQEGRFGKDAFVKPKHFWMFDLAQAVFFAIGNVFYSVSPKGGSLEDRKHLSDNFFAAAATEIARAPEHQKQYIFAVACQYAGNTRDLDVTSREAQKILSEKVQLLQANPWLNKQAAPQVAMVESPQQQTGKMPRELLTQPVEERLDVKKTEAPAHSYAGLVGHQEKVAPKLTEGWSSMTLDSPGGFVPSLN